MWGQGLGGFGGSLWFRWFEASHFEIRDQLVGNLSEDRLSQSRLGSLKRNRERCKFLVPSKDRFTIFKVRLKTKVRCPHEH